MFDWKIPNEWKLKNAYIKDYKGNYILDIKNNYLHVASYSQPVKKKISFNDLKKKYSQASYQRQFHTEHFIIKKIGRFV